jgi:hypothetical protein
MVVLQSPKPVSLPMRIPRKPILVTGSHKSGSTWAGQMLAAAPRTAYIQEPSNIEGRIGVTNSKLQYPYQYICEENSDRHKLAYERIIRYRYPLVQNLTKLRSVRDTCKLLRDQVLFITHKIKNDTPILKDPLAFFSAEWLSRTFDMNVLVLIRHPAAFCSSLKIQNWKFDFNNFLDQPLLMKAFLGRFEDEISEYAENEKGIIEQAILLWNCFYHTITIYRKAYPKWLFVRHENLSLEPVLEFRSIYDRFGLEFTPQSKARIFQSSGAHNATEHQAESQTLRNSRESIHNWKSRLNQDEIDLIKAKTSEYSPIFYAENEW